MEREFTHAGRLWTVRSLGLGSGAGTGAWGDITDWLAVFTVAGTTEPEYLATISAADPNAIALGELLVDLEEALIRHQLDGAPSGLTVSQLAEACALDAGSVRDRVRGMQLDVDEDWEEPDQKRRRFFPRGGARKGKGQTPS